MDPILIAARVTRSRTSAADSIGSGGGCPPPAYPASKNDSERAAEEPHPDPESLLSNDFHHLLWVRRIYFDHLRTRVGLGSAAAMLGAVGRWRATPQAGCS
jgi:hypothetical protein